MNNYSSHLQKIEEILNNFLPENPTSTWIEECFPQSFFSIKKEDVLPLTASTSSLVHRGGKRWRPLLLVLASDLAKNTLIKNTPHKEKPKTDDKAFLLTPAVEFAHTASLIHDDIEDNAEERRGKKAIHIEWGVDTAINSASWLYFFAESCINSFPANDTQKLALYKIFTQNLKNLHLGQAMDIRWHRDNSFFPTLQEYKLMVSLKTGTLARLAAELGMVASGASQEQAKKLGDITVLAGIGFQILDDVLNLLKGNPGKKQGDDIVEGKKSFPILLFIQNHPDKQEEITRSFIVAKKEGIESPAVKNIIDLLNNSKALNEAKKHGLELIAEAKAQLIQNYTESFAQPIIDLFTTLELGLK